MYEIEQTETAVHDALASHADDYEVRGELHRVPPHVTYEVIVDGTRAICKLATHPEDDPTIEARILQYVSRETSVPVPEILGVGEDYFLAAWHEEVPQETPTESETFVRTMGEGLAQLHEEAGFDAYGFPRAGEDGLELDAGESWHAVVCERLADLRDWLEPLGYDDAAEDVLAFVEEHPDIFAGCGDPVLCHGNYLPDHVGVADGELACLIDFEHALVAPCEYDFWRSAVPMFYNVGAGFDEDSLESFRAGYESVRSLPDGVDARRDAYWVVDMVSYLQSLFLQGKVTGEEAHQRAQGFCAFVEQRLDTLDSRCG